MNGYISHAARVISDPQQTYEAKQIAEQILLNAGYCHQDIHQLIQEQDAKLEPIVTFLA